VKNIPISKLLISEIWVFFKPFGTITNIILDERKLACTVHFKEISAAEAASGASPVLGDPKIEIIYNVG
jgi:hypothetical protein